jgi:hypothetical protein
MTLGTYCVEKAVESTDFCAQTRKVLLLILEVRIPGVLDATVAWLPNPGLRITNDSTFDSDCGDCLCGDLPWHMAHERTPSQWEIVGLASGPVAARLERQRIERSFPLEGRHQRYA